MMLAETRSAERRGDREGVVGGHHRTLERWIETECETKGFYVLTVHVSLNSQRGIGRKRCICICINVLVARV